MQVAGGSHTREVSYAYFKAFNQLLGNLDILQRVVVAAAKNGPATQSKCMQSYQFGSQSARLTVYIYTIIYQCTCMHQCMYMCSLIVGLHLIYMYSMVIYSATICSLTSPYKLVYIPICSHEHIIRIPRRNEVLNFDSVCFSLHPSVPLSLPRPATE